MRRVMHDHSLCWLHLIEWAEMFREQGQKQLDQAYGIVWEVADWADEADEITEMYQ
jgi:hypothetical protein